MFISDVEREKWESFAFPFPSRGANIGIIPRGKAVRKNERSEFVLLPRGFAPRAYIELLVLVIRREGHTRSSADAKALAAICSQSLRSSTNREHSDLPRRNLLKIENLVLVIYRWGNTRSHSEHGS